jgi:hypothetical protein
MDDLDQLPSFDASEAPRRSTSTLDAVRRVSLLFVFVAPILALMSLRVLSTKEQVVFNHISGQRTELDEAVHKHFDKTYRVADFTDRDHAYTYPKPASSFGPIRPVYIDNQCLLGTVWVVYVITAEGAVASSHALKSTNPALAKVAVQRMAEWRFQPALLDDRLVSVVATSLFSFPCP